MYDLLIADPVEPWVDAVLTSVAHRPGTVNLLDAGCGTGRHAAAFRDRGCRVTLADASEALLDIARRRCPGSEARLVDLCTMPAPPHYDVITCRGVLNDLVDDAERQAAVTVMAQALRSGGLLMCDLREATASADRANGIPVVTRAVLPSGGQLTFTTTTHWSDGLLLVTEEHVMTVDSHVERSSNQFVMRPWTPAEVRRRFTEAGLEEVTIQASSGRGPDRLTVRARRPG